MLRRVVLLVASWFLVALAPAGLVPEAIAASPLQWNTFLGADREDNAWGVAVDAGGNTYVNGYSLNSWGNPVRPFTGGGSAFVAKLDAAGALVWNTFLGGAPPETIAGGIALDGFGNVYVAGISSSDEWSGPIRPYGGGWYDGFVAKLDPSGNVVWSTYLGGGGDFDFARAVAVDAGGNVFVTGESDASWGAPIRTFTAGSQNAFVAKLDAAGALVWNTFLGGTKGWDIAVGPGGGPCVVGPGGPWGEPIRPFSGGQDAFVAGLDAEGAVAWNTFLGGAGNDWGLGVAIDAVGDIYVSGTSDSPWGEPRRAHASYNDASVAKLSPTGHLLWNTFLGGAGSDEGGGVALDASGDVYVVGSGNAGWGNPILPWAGGDDATVAKLDADGNLAWHTFLGGPAPEGAHGIAVGADGTLFVTGMGGFTWGDPIRPFSSSYDAFVAALRVPVPVAADQALVTAEDAELPIALSAADPDGRDLTYSVVAAPAHGTLSGTPPALVYRPAADFNGDDSFSFTADNGLMESAAAVVSITVTPVNDAPGFAAGADQSVGEDAGAQVVPGWASAIGAGPPDEAGQALAFSVTNDNESLFSAQPAVSADGTLSYAPADDASGSAVVRVTLRDDGDVAEGGADASATLSFRIAVTPVNDAPSFVKGADQSVPEDAGPQSVPAWAAGISVGPADEAGQTARFLASSDDGGLFTVQPAIAPDGTLTFTPAAGAHGSATVTVRLRDDGGTTGGGEDTSAAQSFLIVVDPVNDAPSLGPLGAAQAREGQLLEFTVTAADPDGEIPTLSGGALPEGSRFDPATGLFSWRPRFDQAGEYAVTFAATDAAGASDAAAVAISVLPPSGPVFEDDFADGTSEGDPDWVRLAGRFAGGGGRYAAASTSGLNLARIASLAPDALPLGAGIVKARVRLAAVAGAREPNAMLVFACRDATRFRWAKITPSTVVIGQRGRIDGVAPGIKTKARARHVPGRWYDVAVAISPDGWVRVFRRGTAAPAASFRFRNLSGPSVVPGGVGIAADRAKTLFDDVAVWDGPTPAP